LGLKKIKKVEPIKFPLILNLSTLLKTAFSFMGEGTKSFNGGLWYGG
jgi:hypothetical protein